MSNEAARHIREILDEVRQRWRRLERRRWTARAALSLACVWAAVLVAWLIAARESTAAQVLLVGVAIFASIGCLVLAWRQRAAVPTPQQFARLIEDRVPGLDDRLATTVDLFAAPDEARGAALSAMLVADTARRIERSDVDLVISPETLRRAALQAGGAVLLLLVVMLAARGPAANSGRAALLWLSPERLVLDVAPGDARVPPGKALTIRATTSAASRGLVPELVVRMQEASRTTRMRNAGPDRFAVGFESVPRSFAYQVRVAGRTSREYQVTLLEPPRVGRIDLAYAYPAFTRMAPRTERDGGDIYAPDGTKVAVTVVPKTTTAAVETAWLVLRDGREVPLQRSGEVFKGELAVAGDTAYRVRLRDADGLENDDDPEYFVRRLDDRPPDVRILKPAGDRQVTPLEEVTIEARADDDHGIAHLEVRLSVRGEKWRSVPLAGAGGLTASGRHTVYLEDLDVKPGDFVSYYAMARDVGRGKRPSEARSDIFFLEVTPYVDEFALAQSQAMAGAGGEGMDDLVRLQKDIISGTWKLQRRAAGASAGPSAADVKTLGRAQGALRKRAEGAARRTQMMGPGGRRRRPPAIEPPAAESESAMADAARAMARAEQALNAVKPNDALPPEMEALNHLLRAEAEIRRKEIARQQAGGGGGGSNRAQADLSTLFDRELQRQQETNYETPKSAEEQKTGDQRDELLDRVRELARRQEALQRQQDDLARDRQQMDEAEVRRRLERLTRDQTELRRQADNLAQRMQERARQPSGQQGQQSQQPGQQGGQQQPSQQAGQQAGRSQSSQGGSEGQAQANARALRDASQEMGAAASDLRREAPDEARRRSAKALGRLQELERGMRGTAPDEQRRAAGDAQLEARQLADRQRQLGEETARASKAATEDARRRLAGEQQRLAERADALGERVKRLAESASSPGERQRLAEAARGAEAERLGQQMREVAEGVRKGDAQASQGERQRELARALERLADRVGGSPAAGDREQRQVAEDLSRARDLRERLDELQKQMEALGRSQPPQGDRQKGDASRQAGQPARDGASGQSAQTGDTPAQRQRQLNELRREYLDELRNAGPLRERLEQAAPGAGRATSTPVDQQMVSSAPGTQAFKQDFSRWESLHKEISLGLERFEAALSQRVVERAAKERLRSGDRTTVPERYQRSVDKYYRALAEEPR